MRVDDGKLNLAVVGCGGYAGYLIERLFDLDDICRVTAVTTSRPDSETATDLRGKGVAIYKNLEELLDAVTPETCQAIVIPTSIESHFEYAQKAVQSGFHVLLEKPPVATIQDLDRLIALQNESGRFITVNFQHLFSPMTQKLKRRLAAGDFGKVLAVRASTLWSRPESYFERSDWSGRMMLDGRWVLDGTIGNPLAHLLAEALYLATPDSGMADPVRVTAELYRVNDIESEDTSCLLVETGEGIPVFYYAALSSETAGPVICEIETEQAVIQLKNYCRARIQWRGGNVENCEMEEDTHRDRLIMLRSFIECLASNERPVMTVEECRPYMLAWNGAFESAGVPRVVSSSGIVRQKTEDGCLRSIAGLPELAREAWMVGSLFSGVNTNWAVRTEPVDLRRYSFFPSVHPELVALKKDSMVSVADV